MSEKESMPRFPDIIPNKITESLFHVIEVDDIQTEDGLREFIKLLFDHPERNFYYLQEKDGRSNQLLNRAKNQGDILMDEVEFFYYKHPNFTRDYIKIERRNGKYAWNWEKEVVDKEPMFMRIRLRLTERKKRELEIKQKIDMESKSKDNPLEWLGWKFNLMGLEIDLIKLGRWLIRRIKRE